MPAAARSLPAAIALAGPPWLYLFAFQLCRSRFRSSPQPLFWCRSARFPAQTRFRNFVIRQVEDRQFFLRKFDKFSLSKPPPILLKVNIIFLFTVIILFCMYFSTFVSRLGWIKRFTTTFFRSSEISVWAGTRWVAMIAWKSRHVTRFQHRDWLI